MARIATTLSLVLPAALGIADLAAEEAPARRESTSAWRTTVTPAPAAPAAGSWAASVVRHTSARLVTGALPPSSGFVGHALTGVASYYWQEQMTASGEPFDRAELTAAHRTLPFNTRVRVTHAVSGRAVIVRINDRGPFAADRVIDLSDAAAEQIGMKAQGLAPVTLEVLR